VPVARTQPGIKKGGKACPFDVHFFRCCYGELLGFSLKHFYAVSVIAARQSTERYPEKKPPLHILKCSEFVLQTMEHMLDICCA